MLMVKMLVVIVIMGLGRRMVRLMKMTMGTIKHVIP